MRGDKRVILIFFIGFVMPLATIISGEANEKMLVFRAEPVSFNELCKEWRDYKLKYNLAWSLAKGIILLQ